MTSIDQILRETPSFRRLSAEDRQRVASVARVKTFAKGDTVFAEAEPSDFFYSVASGRVKVVKTLPSGKEVILEVFGAGEPLGAVAVYEGRPFPSSPGSHALRHGSPPLPLQIGGYTVAGSASLNRERS